MNPSYLRLRLPLATPIPRFGEWIGLPEFAPPRRVNAGDAVGEACDGSGTWHGVAVFVHEASGWSVFDDLTGYLASIPAARWVELARDDDLIFAGYNDSVPYGQLIAVQGGKVVRDFLEDLQVPRQNVNRGRLELEDVTPVNDWIAAASFVDDDDLADAEVGEGLLWLFRRAT